MTTGSRKPRRRNVRIVAPMRIASQMSAAVVNGSSASGRKRIARSGG